MSNEAMYESALSGLRPQFGTPVQFGAVGSVEVNERIGIDIANLRIARLSEAAEAGLRAVLGVGLPATPNTVVDRGGVCTIWLGPDEWMLQSSKGEAGELATKIERALSRTGEPFLVTDRSSALSVVQLCGPRARDVLNSGCPLDLHPRVFHYGQCARSLYFQADVLLRPTAVDGGAWELIFNRSFADYAMRMLLDAVRNLSGSVVGLQRAGAPELIRN